MHFTLAGDYVRATGTLRHPATGTLVTNVSHRAQLSTGAGHATLDVPGIAFGPDFQPDELTRLTEGVVALVNGTVRGQGRINWARDGKVTSTGDFATANMDLAAPFGPVTGLQRRPSISPICWASNRAGPGRDGRSRSTPASSSRTGSSITRCCPTSWSGSSAANGRSWAAG